MKTGESGARLYKLCVDGKATGKGLFSSKLAFFEMNAFFWTYRCAMQTKISVLISKSH